MNKLSVGVIGGGIMGIDIAIRLSKEGYAVCILEGESELGGLTSKWSFGDYVWDKFYHVILPDDTYTLEMIGNLGLKSELNWVETQTGFFINGQYYSVSNIIEFLKFPSLNIIDKFRLGLTILVGSKLSDYKRLEEIPVTEWLIRWSGKNTFNKIWLPLLRSKLGEDYKFTSAAFICATIKRLYTARKYGSKKEVFGYVIGGYSRILESLNARLLSENIEIITNFKVKEIRQQTGFEFKVISKEDSQKTFNYLISTVPSSLSAIICPQLADYEIEQLKGIKYLGVVCVSLLVKNPLTPYYVTNITDSNINFTGVIEITSMVGTSFFNGNSLIYLPKYINSNDPLFDLSDESVKDSFIESLKTMQPLFSNEDIITSKVARARYVITLPEMGYSKKLPFWKTTIKNLFIINSSFIKDGTLNVNETLKISDTYSAKVLKVIKNGL
jgi:protoporphyrinogen oxidase